MRGCQKRVIFLKNTGSALFEEAYFVMRSDGTAGVKTEADMVSEAGRIIEENFGKKKRYPLSRLLAFLLSFLGGAAAAFITVLVFY